MVECGESPPVCWMERSWIWVREPSESSNTHKHTQALGDSLKPHCRKRGDLFASFSVQEPYSDAYHDKWYSHQRTRWVIVMATRLIMEMINEALSCYTVSIFFCCIHHILKQTFTQFKSRMKNYMFKCNVHNTMLRCWGWLPRCFCVVARVLGVVSMVLPSSCYGDG